VSDRVLQALLSLVENRRASGDAVHINLFFVHDIHEQQQLVRAVELNGRLLQKHMRRNGKAARKKKRG